jgi:release factor glutamine methyltransferase
MQLRNLIDQLTAQFQEAGIESARADAELLIADCLAVSRGELTAAAILDSGALAVVSGSILENILALAERRAAREPLQHLTGKAYFRNLTLKVGKGVFVPRPETELLAQLGIDALNRASAAAENPEAVIGADLATGSGAIALALATEVPTATIYAVELSPDAIYWTEQNFADAVAAGATAHLRQGDLTDAFQDLNGTLDVLVTNPPYIPVDMVPIYPEVVLHDPEMALYGGQDGLDLVRAGSQSGLRLLKSGGFFAVEHADVQGPSVVELLRNDGWIDVVQHQDFNGRDRVVSATRP